MTEVTIGRRWRWAVLAPTISMILLAGATRDRVGGAHRTVGEPAKDKATTYIDLQPKANQKIQESFNKKIPKNHLAELKQGNQTLEGLKFNIGEEVIRLAGKGLKDSLPEKVEGIQVNAKFATLHILHATAYSVADGTVIAKYVVHYDDQATETIEVVYGKDVRDWWAQDGDEEPTRGVVAWTGSNEAAFSYYRSLWLFALTWKNPRPDKKVVAIDYLSTLTDAAPFVVAMTHTD
jgi:hypothetical protein